MSLFVAQAYADDAASAAGGASNSLMSLLPMVLIFVIFYFLLIRPQMKKQKEQQNMINALKKGDNVMAAGGIVGTIANIDEKFVLLEVSADTKIKVARNSITELMDKKTIKSTTKKPVSKKKKG